MPDNRNRSTEKYLDYHARCAQVFAPFAPVDLPDFFAGRTRAVERLIDETRAPGRQLAIIGARGVGKTSLAALANFFVSRNDDDTFFVRCTESSTFDTIFGDVLLAANVHGTLNGFETSETHTLGGKLGPAQLGKRQETLARYRTVLPSSRITPSMLVKHFHERPGLIIIDEFDRVQDAETHTRVAETLKHFSDARTAMKILIVGVADTVSQLIGQHSSLTRCLGAIELKPMVEAELLDLLQRSEKRLDVIFRHNIKQKIVRLSDGFPHYAHLLGLYTAREAGKVLLADEDARVVAGPEEYKNGIHLSIENVEAQLVEGFQRATVTVKRKSDKFQTVLWSMALADQREVQVGEIAEYASFFTGETHENAEFSYHLGELVKEERGRIIERVREGFYKFTNPLMRPYIRLLLEQMNLYVHGGQLEFPFMRMS